MTIAGTQYQLSPADLGVVLALVRAGNLASAGERLGIDASTVFRVVQRMERGLGQTLFERSRAGYQPMELARTLAQHAELLESQLEQARSATQAQPTAVTGTVRISTTDSVLHALVAPALKSLQTSHPALEFELHSGNELASLTRRDADIAVRATRRPSGHLVGRHVGPIRVALFAARRSAVRSYDDVAAGRVTWVAPDDGLPEHPTVTWRKKHFPKTTPAYRVGSVLTVLELVRLGLGVGALPLFLAAGHRELRQLTEVIDECQTELWLLTHPESRHLRRVSTVFGHLAQHLALD